jgi:hypothetical protein
MTDPQQDYEDKWEQLDEKVIQAQILTELQQIRMLLQSQQEPQSDSVRYRCTKCGATVANDEREAHARREHKAPADKVESLFTEA